MSHNARLAVVGHVEWVQFMHVNRAPAPGRILHADSAWEEPAGGGGVAAAELARLAGRAALFTAVGNDPHGARVAPELAHLDVTTTASQRAEPHRRAVTLLDPDSERTIIVIGPAQWARGGEFELGTLDGVYFCKGDAAMLREARAAASILVVTARVLDVAREARVPIDALVFSATDPGERYSDGELDPPPRLVARTEGAEGGSWWTSDGERGRWTAAPLPGSPVDAYGCGDSFAAGLTFGLATGLPLSEALALAAERGAAALCRRGAHGSA